EDEALIGGGGDAVRMRSDLDATEDFVRGDVNNGHVVAGAVGDVELLFGLRGRLGGINRSGDEQRERQQVQVTVHGGISLGENGSSPDNVTDWQRMTRGRNG